MIGVDRGRGRIELIEAHTLTKVGAEFLQDPTHPLQDEIALAPPARPAEEREPRRARYRLGDADGEIEGLMTGQENPRPGLHRIGVGNTAPTRCSTDFTSGVAIGISSPSFGPDR